MTELLKNIEAQPGELLRSLEYTLGPGRRALERAAALLHEVSHLYLTGIGSSWHAGMAVQSLFESAGRPVHLVDASELLHTVQLPPKAAVVMLSRSGKSVEIVKLLEKAQAAKARVIGVTNTPGSPLARRAEVTLPLHAAFDHNISITMYSALALVGGLLAGAVVGARLDALGSELQTALEAAGRALPEWRERVEGHAWFAREAPAYFLARGGSLASCHETRLLWEEGAKAPASAMSSGGFRHGPQEIVAPGLRVGLWIAPRRLRNEDLALAADLRQHGAQVMLIGQGLPEEAGDLVFSLPPVPAEWQFLIEIVPGQLAAEYLARQRSVDCDNFTFCPYIIQSEGGLRADAPDAGASSQTAPPERP